MPRYDNLGMDRTDTHPMPLNGLDRVGARETPTDEVFRPWAETMPALDPAEEALPVHPSRSRALTFIAGAISLAGLLVYALRTLFKR
jgi:hypothetical protein